jgi:hypothetical protein
MTIIPRACGMPVFSRCPTGDGPGAQQGALFVRDTRKPVEQPQPVVVVKAEEEPTAIILPFTRPEPQTDFVARVIASSRPKQTSLFDVRSGAGKNAIGAKWLYGRQLPACGETAEAETA